MAQIMTSPARRNQYTHEASEHKVLALKTAVAQGLIGEDIPLAGFVDVLGIAQTIKQIKASFPAHFHHHFAVKANSLHGVLKRFRENDIGAEVASPGELAQALKAGFDKQNIVFDEPAKSRKVIQQALKAGVNLNIDNFQEFEFVAELVEQLKPQANFGFRINPQIGAGSIEAMSTATKTSKFGVPLADRGVREKLVKLYSEHRWLNAIHSHVGSQGCPLPMMATGIRAVVDLAEEINAVVGHQQIKHINIGGGLTVNFNDEAVTPSHKEYAAVLEQRVPELFSGKYRVLTEFGRSIMAKNGFFAARVEYTKVSGGRHIAITHGGSQIAARSTFMPQAWPLRITAHDPSGKIKTSETQVQDIAGPCCFAGDMLAKTRELPKLERDDYVMVHETGAYYFSNPFYYNSLPTPPVYTFEQHAGEMTLTTIRRGQTVEEMMAVIG